MTRTVPIVRAELAAVNLRCTELEVAWVDRTEATAPRSSEKAPAEELSALLLRRDVLADELKQLTAEDVA